MNTLKWEHSSKKRLQPACQTVCRVITQRACTLPVWPFLLCPAGQPLLPHEAFTTYVLHSRIVKKHNQICFWLGSIKPLPACPCDRMATELTTHTLTFSWAHLFPRRHVQKTESYRNSSRLAELTWGRGNSKPRKASQKRFIAFQAYM